MPISEFYEYLKQSVEKHAGLFNAHLHLDRANTLARRYLEHMSMDPIEASSYSLRVKQNLTGDLHRGPAYETDDLYRRIDGTLDEMVKVGTVRADSFIDVSCDNVGLDALEIALDIKSKRDDIDFRVGAYPIFGFKDHEPQRWKLFVKAAKMADYIGCLPERDDKQYHPSHIGFDEHFRRTLNLAIKLRKPIHYHVDQANDPREIGTKTLIEAVRWIGSPITTGTNDNEPTVWAVHSISPSAYPEKEFKEILHGLKKYNIGVICCPSAAISMRQLRPLSGPTHNSIARVLDMIVNDIPVRIGSDNVSDVFLPSTTSDLYDEILVLSNAIRLYKPDILAKLACGVDLTDMDRDLVRRSLEQDKAAFRHL